jgi:hypothetical protein
MCLTVDRRCQQNGYHMEFWDFFFILFIFIPLTIAWIYTVVDIFQRPDERGLTKFLWLLLILFVPILGMLVYFIARPDDVAIVARAEAGI